MRKKLQVSVVILTFNSLELILNCLKSLKKISLVNIDLTTIVVDNGSKAGVVENIQQKYPQVIVIDNKKNYGFARGINYGLKLAYEQNTDYILLLNDDTLLSKDFLKKLVNESEKNCYYISGPLIKTANNTIWSLGGTIDKLRFSGGLIGYGQKNNISDKNQLVDFISGTAMLVKREVFEKVGFMDEDYFLYYDDVDFCFRAKKMGYDSYIIPSSKIIHLETATIKKNSPAHYYHSAKSHLIFVFKRAPIVIKLRELLRLGKTVIELLNGTKFFQRKYDYWS